MNTQAQDISTAPGDLAPVLWRSDAGQDGPALQTLVDTEAASREQCEQFFVRSLPLMRSVIATVSRRYRLSGDQAEEFGAVVRLRIIEGDYAVLRKFRGRSSLRTYLTVVVGRMFLDYRDAQWGKWRPSAASRRQGAHAVRLERLTMRDGLTFEEAWAELEATRTEPLDRGALEAIHAQLRPRSRRQLVTDQDLDLLPAARAVPEDALLEVEHAAVVARAASRVSDALAGLDPQDRVIVRRHFFEATPVSAVARELGLDQRHLYRRLARLMGTLRAHLERQGVSGSELLEAMEKSRTIAEPPLAMAVA